MRFEILGPLRVFNAGREVVVTARRERVVLAALLWELDRVVAVPRLAEAAWEGRLPADRARGQVQGCVSRLRRRFTEAGAPAEVIVTAGAGYRLRAGSGAVDLVEFGLLRERAAAAAAAGRSGEAVEWFRQALGLWRGRFADGLGSRVLDRAATALEEQRRQTLEACLRAELEIGRAGELVSELTALAQQHPFHEPFHGLLMLALYRAGRQSDALAAYQEISRRLREELGTEPGEGLRRLHRDILRQAPRLGARRPVSVIPHELPAEASGFTGRDDALKLLDEAGTGSTAARVVVITGSAGVGKTALAVHWARRMLDRFPDGQVYLDLRGYSPAPPMRPPDALMAVLHSLGAPPEAVPAELPQAAGYYRSYLAGRRVLILLDDAATVEQVRPLIPGTAECLLLVTSRRRLAGLIARDGAHPVGLDALTTEDTQALPTRILGPERVAGQTDALGQLTTACANLPLALRIAAAHLTSRPQWKVIDYVTELTSHDRLAALTADGDQHTAVRAAFELSYQNIPTGAQRMFRLYGVVPGPNLTPSAAAAALDIPVDAARQALDQLTANHLISEFAYQRFSPHELLRLYAQQLATDHQHDDQPRQAIIRLLAYYLQTVDAAARMLYPQLLRLSTDPPACVAPATQFASTAEARTWLDAELPNLVPAITHAAHHGPRETAWELTDNLRGYFGMSRRTAEWQTATVSALTAATKAHEVQAQAAIQLSMGRLDDCRSRYPDALARYQTARALSQQAGWKDGEATASGNAGLLHQFLGNLAEATELYQQTFALRSAREPRQPGQIATSRLCLGFVSWDRGELRTAEVHLGEALTLYRQASSAAGEAITLEDLGLVKRDLGDLPAAATHLQRSLEIRQELNDLPGIVGALVGLATVDLAKGNRAKALELADASVATADELGDAREQARARHTLGLVRTESGAAETGLAEHQRALDAARRVDLHRLETAALLGLATAHHSLGQLDRASSLVSQALGLAQQTGYRILAAQAATLLAEISLSADDPAAAQAHANRALALHRQTGHRPGEARTQALLAGLPGRPPGRRPAV